MVENYNPTRKEVLREAFSGVNLKNTRSKLKQVGGDFIAMASISSLCPYIIPTTVRLHRDIESLGEKVEIDVADYIGLSAGLIAGVGSYIVQVGGYLYAVEHDHPEALLIPVATNVVSGVYEVGRKIYNNARQKILDKHNAEGLESTLK